MATPPAREERRPPVGALDALIAGVHLKICFFGHHNTRIDDEVAGRQVHRPQQGECPRLQAVRIDGDWEAWLGFFLRGVQEVATEAVVCARKIIELRERARGIASERGGRKSGNLLRAIDSLFKQPLVTANSLAKEIGVSFVTANGIALTLADLELLTEETGYKRNRRFRFAPYLALFEEPRESDEEAPAHPSRARPQSRG